MAAINPVQGQLQNEYDEDVPGHYVCSISHEPMIEPVQVDCGQGHIFDRIQIVRSMQFRNTCPQCRGS